MIVVILLGFQMTHYRSSFLNISSLVPSAPFLYPLKTSENLTVFCFRGVEKRCIGNEWVKTGRLSCGNKIHTVTIHSYNDNDRGAWVNVFLVLSHKNKCLRVFCKIKEKSLEVFYKKDFSRNSAKFTRKLIF